MSQQQLAIEAELTRAYIGRIETQGGNVGLETIQALSQALDVEPTEFFVPAEGEGSE